SARARSCEPSVLPLSATMTSPLTPSRSRQARALATHVPTVRASFRHGMTTLTSGSVSVSDARGASRTVCIKDLPCHVEIARGRTTGDRLHNHRSRVRQEQTLQLESVLGHLSFANNKQ